MRSLWNEEFALYRLIESVIIWPVECEEEEGEEEYIHFASDPLETVCCDSCRCKKLISKCLDFIMVTSGYNIPVENATF